MKSLPFVYANSKNAWMTSDIFAEWFQSQFIPSVRKHLRSRKLPEKAVLLLDNCPAHPPADTLKSRDGLITVAYLPKNTTSLIQPLDQGIISTFKKLYRRELVSNIISTDMPVTDFLKSMSIKDFFYAGQAAWKAISPSTIEGCWMRGLAHTFGEDAHDLVPSDENIAANAARDNDDDSDEEFDGFSAEEVADVHSRQFQRFHQRLNDDGITVTTDDVNVWLECDEQPSTADLLNDEELIQSVTSATRG